jgi:rhodanese-related sulfurtransferase
MNFIINYVRRQFPDVPCIDTDKAKEWIIDDPQAKILLIDCRRPDEFKVSKIPGAVNVNFRCSDDELKDALKDIEADSKIVNYCSLGYRSAIMTDRICQLGQKNNVQAGYVFNMEGSIFKWANEDKPLLDKDEQSTK